MQRSRWAPLAPAEQPGCHQGQAISKQSLPSVYPTLQQLRAACMARQAHHSPSSLSVSLLAACADRLPPVLRLPPLPRAAPTEPTAGLPTRAGPGCTIPPCGSTAPRRAGAAAFAAAAWFSVLLRPNSSGAAAPLAAAPPAAAAAVAAAVGGAVQPSCMAAGPAAASPGSVVAPAGGGCCAARASRVAACCSLSCRCSRKFIFCSRLSTAVSRAARQQPKDQSSIIGAWLEHQASSQAWRRDGPCCLQPLSARSDCQRHCSGAAPTHQHTRTQHRPASSSPAPT